MYYLSVIDIIYSHECDNFLLY